MKKITIFLDGSPSLTFVGTLLLEQEVPGWYYYKDNVGIQYNIQKKYIVAIIEENV